MKKLSLITASFLCATSLMAADLATYSGGKITDDDVKPYLMQYKIQSISALPADAKEMLIKEVLAKKLLAAEAIKAKIDKEPEFVKALASTKETMLAQSYLLKKFDKVEISEADIKKYYDEHLSDFVMPEAVKTAHILVKTEKEAKSIISELKGLKDAKLAEKFAQLAKEKSLDKGSAKMGGELPYMGAADLVPEYFNAARGLKKGEISAPVKSQFGFHIIFGQDHKAERQGTLEEAKPFIVNGLKTEKQREMVAAETKKLVDGAKLIIK